MFLSGKVSYHKNIHYSEINLQIYTIPIGIPLSFFIVCFILVLNLKMKTSKF